MLGFIHGLGDGFERPSIGLVINTLAALVFNRLPLDLEFLLGDRLQQQAHAIRLQPEGNLQLVDRQGLKLIGAVRVSGSVQGAASITDNLEVLFIADVLGALEHHVLEEVCEAGAPDFLAIGAHVVGHVYMYQGIGVILVQDHRQPVIQPIFAVRNGDAAVIPSEFLHQREALGQCGDGIGLVGGGLGRFLASCQNEQQGYD